MDFKYAVLQENYTKDDVRKEIERLKRLKNDEGNKDQAIKVILNSVYGVIGFDKFICYHRDVAQTVTKQSEDLIKYTIVCFNTYFSTIWPSDTETHQKMGITKCRNIEIPAVNYADTDSIFIVLDKVRAATDFTGTAVEFALGIYNNALKKFIDDKLDEYTSKFNGLTNMNDVKTKTLSLEMESVEHQVLWVAKKKYIKETAFKKKIHFKKLESITVKGLEYNQSATPRFVRKKLKAFIDFVFEAEGAIDITKLVDFLIIIKDEFYAMQPEEISKIERITDYEKYITHSKDADGKPLGIIIGPDCKPHTRAGGFYNHMLDIHTEYKMVYDRVNSGNKVHWYYAKDKNRDRNMDVFGFLSGQYPVEFALEMDFNLQFESTFLGPVNNILKVIGVNKLDASLIYMPVFSW